MRGAAVPAPLRAYPFERGCDESRASPCNGRQAQLSSGIPALIAGNSAALTLIVGDQARIEQPVCATRYSSPAQPGEERGQSLLPWSSQSCRSPLQYRKDNHAREALAAHFSAPLTGNVSQKLQGEH